MRRHGSVRRAWFILCGAALLGSVVSGVTSAQSNGRHDDFVYRAQARDTLIGLGRRLLREPGRWVEVQSLNSISNPRRIPLGTEIRIPYDWLRTSVEVAAVSAVSGMVRSGGKDIAQGETLPQGSLIQTGADGSITLNLADGSVITVQKSSALRLESLQQVSGVEAAHDIRLRLESGRIQTAVKPHRDVGRFEIATPVAVSAVRGTEFRTAFDPDGAHATDETLDGTVGVWGVSAEVPVPAGFGTRVEHNGIPLAPVRLLPPPDLSSIAASNSAQQLKLQWPPVAGAMRYRVQIAPDPSFQTIFADTESTDSSATLTSPPDGRFWLRIRSIDQLSLEGPDASKELTQHLLPPPPALVTPEPGARVAGSGAAFFWSGTDGTRYRWQLSRDPQFTAPVMERETNGTAGVEVNNVEPGHYLWRVATIDAHGEIGDWSAPRDYTQRPIAPTLEVPSVTRRGVELHWAGSAATRYHVQIARDPTFTRLVVDRTVDDTQLSIPRPHAGVYYARVQIVTPNESNDPFEPSREFEVPLPLWIRIMIPLGAVALIAALT